MVGVLGFRVEGFGFRALGALVFRVLGAVGFRGLGLRQFWVFGALGFRGFRGSRCWGSGLRLRLEDPLVGQPQSPQLHSHLGLWTRVPLGSGARARLKVPSPEPRARVQGILLFFVFEIVAPASVGTM